MTLEANTMMQRLNTSQRGNLSKLLLAAKSRRPSSPVSKEQLKGLEESGKDGTPMPVLNLDGGAGIGAPKYPFPPLAPNPGAGGARCFGCPSSNSMNPPPPTDPSEPGARHVAGPDGLE